MGPPQSSHVHPKEEKSKNSHSQENTAIQYIVASCVNCINRKTKEFGMKYGFYLMIMHHFRFINCNK